MSVRTGGTGDVRPQITTVQATQATVNQESVFTITTPIPRAQTRNNAAQVMEVLSVDWTVTGDEGDLAKQFYCYLSTSNPGATTGTASTVARFSAQVRAPQVFSHLYEVYAQTTSGELVQRYPFKDRKDDGAGHGILIATDSVVLVLGTVGATAAISATIKLTYRLINVGIFEYVGLVQAQQQVTAAQ